MIDPAFVSWFCILYLSKGKNSFCDTFKLDVRALDIDKKKNNAIAIAMAKNFIVAYDCNIQQSKVSKFRSLMTDSAIRLQFQFVWINYRLSRSCYEYFVLNLLITFSKIQT